MRKLIKKDDKLMDMSIKDVFLNLTTLYGFDMYKPYTFEWTREGILIKQDREK